MEKKLTKNNKELYFIKDWKKIIVTKDNIPSYISWDISDISWNVSDIRWDVSYINWNIDDCNITEKDLINWRININDLIK